MTEILLGPLDEFPEGDYRVLAVGEFQLGVFHFDGRLTAWENHCPHAEGPVCQGRVFNKVDEALLPDQTSVGLHFGAARHVVCPWHGFEFNLQTGEHPGDARYRLRAVPLEVREALVFAQIP
jgi:nitrite reductase (NADH) small subunit